MRDVVGDFRRAAADRDWCAAVDDDGRWSARELLDEAGALAEHLAGGAANPTILVQAQNSRRLVVAALAAGLVDGTLALAAAHATAEDLAAIVDATRPDAVFGEAGQLDRWRVGGNTVGAPVVGWQVRLLPGLTEHGRWGGGVLIGMTSGSTGRSKGVVHRESALRYAAEQEIAATGLQPGDAVGIIVPISAAPAFAFGIFTALLLRSAAVLSARWDPAGALRRLSDHEAKWLMCVPTQVLQLSEVGKASPGALRSMRAITVGGGPMELRTLAEAERNLGTTILRVFGMSECLGHTTPRLDDPPELRLDRDGRPFPGTELRIVDGDGNPVQDGMVGRARVKGPSLFMGYAEGGRLVPPELTADGYLDTGDLMVRYADGTIRVAGRVKDVVIRGGRNISIAEVESAVMADARVEQVCVVPVPDAVLGERVAALVVANDDQLSLDSLRETLTRNGVAKATWPEFLVLVRELPMTAVGKFARLEAREIALEMIGLKS